VSCASYQKRIALLEPVDHHRLHFHGLIETACDNGQPLVNSREFLVEDHLYVGQGAPVAD